MSFYIGDVFIENNLVLAPMAGNTNEAFRVICKKMGVGLVVAEMVSDKALGYKNKKTLKMTLVNKDEHPLSMQIFGGEKESLVNAAIYIDKYTDADIIDINMGCPVNKVANKSHAGASLLKDPELVYELTKAVVDSVKKPVTVKIRIGWDANSINAVTNAIMIEKAGAKAITVHGRTRSQFYSGKADLEQIRLVKEAVKIPVIGNGDITDIKSALHMFEYTKCDAIAIGRATLGNPFIFRELNAYFNSGLIIPKPTNQELYDTITLHHKLLVELKDEKLALLEMRGHISYYLKGKPNAAKIRNEICQIKDYNEVDRIIKAFLLG